MTRTTIVEGKSDATTEKAVAWFARMHSDQRTQGDEDRFAQWLKQSPHHAEAYARVEKVWRAVGPEITPRPLASERTPRPNVAKQSRRTRWSSASAAAILAAVVFGVLLLGAVVAGLLMLSKGGRISTGTFHTDAGVLRELKLADGSTIVLNTRSEVRIALEEHRRSVRLLRGEARFQVAKNPARPFIVDAGAAQVRAVGTAFDVRVSDEHVSVTLVEGQVEITPASSVIEVPEPTWLTAGQKFSLDVTKGEQRVETVSLERVDAWLDRQLIFDSTPLVDAIEEANRYLPRPIVIDDPDVSAVRVSGVVRAGDSSSFIAALESSFPVQAIKQSDGRIALRRRGGDERR